MLLAILLTACDSTPSAAGPTTHAPPVTVAAAPAVAPLPAPQPMVLGMNLGSATLDWEPIRLYADVMRIARDFERPQGGAASLDAEGWPQEDFKVVVWHGIPQMHGLYTLSFRGRGQVSASWSDVVLSTPRYDAAANTTTLTLDCRSTGGSGLELRLTDTQRSADAPKGSGVTHVSLMRPTSPGARTSHPYGALFNEAAKDFLKRFAVLRFMDFVSTNSNQQREWADRQRPVLPSFNRGGDKDGYAWQGRGGPWEHVVALANELGVDVWINVPVRASDDYVRKLAQLFKNGSDGTQPYAAPTAQALWPPLQAGRKLYVEYGNELWNSAGPFGDAFRYNLQQAKAEVTAGRSPLAFDGEKNEFYWGWRRVAKRGLEVSRIFREVFGDDAMGARVRPVLCTQQGDAQETLSQAARLLHGYYNNGEGAFVEQPRPPSYWFYGAGGSAYYGPDNHSDGLTLDNLWGSDAMSLAVWQERQARDADVVAALGLRRVAYEGGPSLDKTGHSELVKEMAARAPRMTTAIEEHHRAWAAYGGDLLVYFHAVGDYQWGFTGDLQDRNTPKLQALERVRAMTPVELAHGTAIPGSTEGNQFSMSAPGEIRPGRGARAYSSAPRPFRWGAYTFRASTPSSRVVVLDVSKASADAEIVVYWDGQLVGRARAPRGSGSVELPGVTVTPGLHGVIVGAASGTFDLEKVSVR